MTKPDVPSELALSPRPVFFPRGLLVVALAMTTTGLFAVRAAAGDRSALGDKYARAFSDSARFRSVTWDDRSCTFAESTPEARRSDLAATLTTMIPARQVTGTAQGRASRVGTLEVTFRCDPAAPHCITRRRQQGSSVVGTEQLTGYTIPIEAPIPDAPRIAMELAELRAACGAGADGGP